MIMKQYSSFWLLSFSVEGIFAYLSCVWDAYSSKNSQLMRQFTNGWLSIVCELIGKIFDARYKFSKLHKVAENN
jgi:hypothetical protein